MDGFLVGFLILWQLSCNLHKIFTSNEDYLIFRMSLIHHVFDKHENGYPFPALNLWNSKNEQGKTHFVISFSRIILKCTKINMFCIDPDIFDERFAQNPEECCVLEVWNSFYVCRHQIIIAWKKKTKRIINTFDIKLQTFSFLLFFCVKRFTMYQFIRTHCRDASFSDLQLFLLFEKWTDEIPCFRRCLCLNWCGELNIKLKRSPLSLFFVFLLYFYSVYRLCVYRFTSLTEG